MFSGTGVDWVRVVWEAGFHDGVFSGFGDALALAYGLTDRLKDRL